MAEAKKEGLVDFNNQLYTALADLFDSEPLSLVKNVPTRNGLEAWRKLHFRFDPQVASRIKDSYNRIVYTQPYALEQLPNAIEVWEDLYRQHVDSGKPAINEGILVKI